MNPEYGSTDGPLDEIARNRTLGRLAHAIQPALSAFFESGDGKRRVLKDLLHGTYIGHPLHPVLTDIPVGAWSVAAVCDGLDFAGARGLRTAADAAIVIGAAAAVGAAVTGFADWSDTKEEPQKLGMLHAILNSAALLSYLTSIVARRTGARGFGRLTAFAGYGLMSAAAYLGGELSLGMQLGVKHTSVPIEPPKDFQRVLDASALTAELMHAAELETMPLLVTRIDGEPRAVSGVCTHRGAPLTDGTQEANCVRCPWHGSRFSLESGRVVEGPATFALASFDAHVKGDGIMVRAKSSR